MMIISIKMVKGKAKWEMDDKVIAHVRKNDDGTWASPQLLSEHLENTARLSEIYAVRFHSGEWGKVAGLAHDAGKGRLLWQNYIRQKSGFYNDNEYIEGKLGKVTHAIHGAVLVEKLFGKACGRFLAYCIAGHHAGLPDWSSAEGAGQSSLQFQETQVKDLEKIDTSIIEKIQAAKLKPPLWKFSKGLDVSLWIRMLYSCLVDADFLDTESYMNESQADIRGGYCSIPELLERYNQFTKHLDTIAEDSRVNKIRRDIRKKCIQAAHEPQGIFSLSVPTGGGKTLSSLAFGLEHAKKHNLDRIIYVIPYTSIIEQNADVFRLVVGEDQVVEHHSSLDEDTSTLKSRLATENWDAPIIVTTSVQFFESLFAAKSSRCRKSHNIVNSVVILDEAQLVPIEYLNPILEVMQLLVEHYHVTFVISTATQPAFGERIVAGQSFKGLKKINEIMGNNDDVKELYDSLKRVHVQLPDDIHTLSTWEEIAKDLKQYDQVLCIVSDRKSCRELYRLMPEGTYHLSALMCGQHRSEVIKEIKEKLKNQEPVRVISTQLVEAGVDFDFPVVYRALAGLDSIVQAAGRCNREGKLSKMGKVVVFNPPRKAPIGILRKAAETTLSIFSSGYDDPLEQSKFEKYFSELYWKANSLDSMGIVSLLSPDYQECGINFRTAAERFKLIDDSIQKTILIRYGESDKWIDLLKAQGPERWLMRKLQRYTVNVYNDDFNLLLRQGSIEEIQPNIFALTTNFVYSKDIGLLVDETFYNPEHFII
ncbi:MAG: CRISPR-associated helicase Cas3' [Parabacteroides sp.]|mgnify:CR=1 FL=1|nr:CRISPR-associated helicase Cas3' [Parabacteroides sp.]